MNRESKIMNKRFKISLFLTISLFVAVLYASLFINPVSAATNIDSTYRYAWSEVIGWIDFYITNNVNVFPNRLEGYATSSVGYVALNCNTTPNGNICGTSDFKVANDGSGNLTGWAWNDAIGWISFDSASAGSPYVYQVTINSVNGNFSGWAWNDLIGWISFNCNNSGIGDTCGTSDYKVKTSWIAESTSGDLTSSVFDTTASSGVAVNSIMWQGNHPSNTSVKFQIASSDSQTGPWSYIGPDGSSSTYYEPTGDNVPVPINLSHHNNKRYFRYKIFLESNVSQTETPRVDDVIINYSP